MCGGHAVVGLLLEVTLRWESWVAGGDKVYTDVNSTHIDMIPEANADKVTDRSQVKGEDSLLQNHGKP